MGQAKRRGRLIVISGPSGTGKTTICNELLRRLPGSRWSVSATTRPIRPNEEPDRNYHFIGREEFERRQEAGGFLETAEYLGHWYGTPVRPLDEATAGPDRKIPPGFDPRVRPPADDGNAASAPGRAENRVGAAAGPPPG